MTSLLPIVAQAPVNLGPSIQLGLACLGAGIGIGVIGAGVAIAIGRNPGASMKVLVWALLFFALSETVVFYAVALHGAK